jgi:pilus assembly protein CpaF
MDGTVIQVQEIFKFQRNPQGGGEFRATGLRPTFMEALLENGAELPAQTFHPGAAQ